MINGETNLNQKVKIIVDIKETEVAKSIEPLNPSKLKSAVDRNKVAIFGISDYKKLPQQLTQIMMQNFLRI